jgi:hypothetical protein
MSLTKIQPENEMEKELLENCPNKYEILKISASDTEYFLCKETEEGTEIVGFGSNNELFASYGKIGVEKEIINIAIFLSSIIEKHAKLAKYDFKENLKEYEGDTRLYLKSILFKEYEDVFEKEKYTGPTINNILENTVALKTMYGMKIDDTIQMMLKFISFFAKENIEEMPARQMRRAMCLVGKVRKEG